LESLPVRRNRHAIDTKLPSSTGCRTARATGVIEYLKNGPHPRNPAVQVGPFMSNNHKFGKDAVVGGSANK